MIIFGRHPINALFESLTEALDYAAEGKTGLIFYTRRGVLYASLPYQQLQTEAQSLARKMPGRGLKKGNCIALIAKTGLDFLRFFFAARYAGLVPVALPAPFNLYGFDSPQLAAIEN